MTVPLFDSPENAASQGISSQHSRVVASRTEGDDAFVLLDSGPSGQPYLYGVCCSRHDGRWRRDTTGEGPGWTQAGPDPFLGTLTCWAEAPAGADRVRIEYEGRTIEEPVNDVAYLAVWWRVPDHSHFPTVTAFRIRGEWQPA